MSNPISPPSSTAVTRRQFLKESSLVTAGAAALAQLPFVQTGHAAPDDPICIGLIGCGGRGTGAVADALGAATDVNYPQAGYHTENVKANAKTSARNVQVVALADVFPDRLNACREQLQKLSLNIPSERCFVGFDAYQDLMDSIRAGAPLNEAKAVAESTLTGILGRESAYTGRSIEWDEALNSTNRLGPTTYQMGNLPFPEVPMPGQYKFA